MTMDGRPAATRAIWPDIEKLICAKLDSFSNPESAVEINSSVLLEDEAVVDALRLVMFQGR